MKNPSRKTLRNKADKLWSKAVRSRDKDICQFCFKRGNNPHHIYTKGGHPATRHDVDNGITLCVYHHRGLAHAKPEAFIDWLESIRGKQWVNLLRLKANTSGKSDYQMNIIELQLFIEAI